MASISTTSPHRSRRRRRHVPLLLVVLALIATSCSPGPEEAESLTEGSIRTGALGELDRICIDGVDPTADLSDLELIVTAEGGESPSSLTLYQSGDVLYATLPLHPATPGEGGTIEIALVSGDDQLDAVTIDLAALPDGSGTWDNVIDVMRAQLAHRAQGIGSSLEELSTMPFDTVGSDELPLKTVLTLVDDELAGYLTSEDAELSDEGRALVEAIVAKIGFEQLVPGAAADPSLSAGCVGALSSDAMTGDPRSPGGDAVAAPTGRRAMIDTTHAQPAIAVSATAVRTAAAQGESCRVFELDIPDGEALASAVETGVDAKVREGGAEERVLQDIESLTGTLENAPGVYGDLISAIGLMFTTITLWFEMDAAVYPTKFTSIDANVTITQFNEDFTEDGALTSARVVAESIGFDPVETFSKIAAEIAETVAGAAVGKIAEGLPDSDAGLEQRFALFLGGKIRKAIFENLINRVGEGLWNYCPQTWTVDITDPDYIDFSRVLPGFIDVDKNALTYKPIDVGSNSLRIRALAEVFSGLTVQTDVPVETKRIRVVATPDLIRVDTPGETVDITARIENADTTTLFWNTPHGSWTDGVGADTNDGRTRPFKTPTSKEAYPFNIEIRSTSQTGLREGVTESDPRTTVVRVELKDLIVTPNPGSVLVEEELEFLATDSEGEPQAVTWSATGGSISSSDFDNVVTGAAIYTAFDEPGTYTVTATKTDGSGISETVEVEVVDACNPLGTWRMREQDFLDQVAALSSETGVELTHTGGAYYVVFEGDKDGGTFISDRDAWAFIMQVPQGALLAEISGTETGTWSFNGAQMEINTSGGDVTVSLGIEIDGEFRQLPGSGGADTTTGPSFSSAVVECTANVMTTTVSEGAASITVTLDKVS